MSRTRTSSPPSPAFSCRINELCRSAPFKEGPAFQPGSNSTLNYGKQRSGGLPWTQICSPWNQYYRARLFTVEVVWLKRFAPCHYCLERFNISSSQYFPIPQRTGGLLARSISYPSRTRHSTRAARAPASPFLVIHKPHAHNIPSAQFNSSSLVNPLRITYCCIQYYSSTKKKQSRGPGDTHILFKLQSLEKNHAQQSSSSSSLFLQLGGNHISAGISYIEVSPVLPGPGRGHGKALPCARRTKTW